MCVRPDMSDVVGGLVAAWFRTWPLPIKLLVNSSCRNSRPSICSMHHLTVIWDMCLPSTFATIPVDRTFSGMMLSTM